MDLRADFAFCRHEGSSPMLWGSARDGASTPSRVRHSHGWPEEKEEGREEPRPLPGAGCANPMAHLPSDSWLTPARRGNPRWTPRMNKPAPRGWEGSMALF